MQIVSVIYRLAVAFWVGGVAIFTFVLTPIIFKVYSRDTAGQFVGVLFPAYFRWGLACGVLALISQLVLRGKNLVPACALLVVMLAFSAFQSFYIEPRAAAIKKEITSFESTTKDHPLRKAFSKLHAVSAVCNLAVFGGGVVLIILM